MENYTEFEFTNKCFVATTTTTIGNMAFHLNNEVEDVLARRQSLAQEMGISYEKFTFAHQNNSAIINEITSENNGKGIYNYESGIDGDGLFTNEKNMPLCIFNSDAVVIFFYDEINKTVGILNAGFNGTVKHTIGTMMQTYLSSRQSDPRKIKIFVGPCLQEKSFDIALEQSNILFESNLTSFIHENHFDMKGSYIHDLLSLGILEENIVDCNLDTYTDVRFFSEKEKIPSGKMVSIIYLK